MAKVRKHVWFIHPKNSHTNEVIARFACEGTFGFESDVLKDALCQDGKERNLWRVSEDNIWFLWRSRTDLKFEIFNRLGCGQIRNVTFLFRRERRKPKTQKGRRVA